MSVTTQVRRQTIKAQTLSLLILLIFSFSVTSDTDALVLNLSMKGGDSGKGATHDDLLLKWEVTMTGSERCKAYIVTEYLRTVFALQSEKLTSGLKSMITFLAIKIFEASENPRKDGDSVDLFNYAIRLKMDQIARACNVNRRTIVNYVNKAQQLQIIQIVGRRQQGRLNVYKLNPIEKWVLQPNEKLQFLPERPVVHKRSETAVNITNM